MSPNAQKLLEEARRLPANEFNWLIGEMLQHDVDSADEELSASEIEASWSDEIKRRLDEIDSGAVKMIPHEEFLADLDAHIASKQRE
jgi:putative addiction module component (TIGR02574 family)